MPAFSCFLIACLLPQMSVVCDCFITRSYSRAIPIVTSVIPLSMRNVIIGLAEIIIFCRDNVLLDFSLTVKAATLIFISGRDSAI